MAIQDHSALTEMTARTMLKGADGASELTAGTVTPEQEAEIERIVNQGVQTSVFKTTGILPQNVYNDVATVLKPSTPGMKVEAISKVLQTNGVFGLNKSYSNNYDLISRELNLDVSRIINNNMTGGLLGDIANEVGYHTDRAIQETVRGIVNGNGDQIVLTDTMNNSVAAILSGTDSIIYNSLPTPVKDIVGPYVIGDMIDTIIEGDMKSIGGGADQSITDGAVNLVEGKFGVNFSSLTKDERGSVAAESIVESTDAVNADKEKLAQDLEANVGPTLGSDGSVANDPEAIDIGTPEIKPGTDFVSSVEELEAEMGSMTREISEIIVHWSETYSDANLSAEQLDELTGAGKSAYHLIIKRDGSIQRGVPMNSVGSHCPTNGHDAFSIGVCLIGGLNISSGDTEIDQLGANSITRSQFNSLYQIFRTFFNQYPGGQALGHMDTDITQDDPGFDVRDYVYNNFNKTSLYLDPLNDPALSPSDILKALDAEGPVVGEKDPDVMDKKF